MVRVVNETPVTVNTSRLCCVAPSENRSIESEAPMTFQPLSGSENVKSDGRQVASTESTESILEPRTVTSLRRRELLDDVPHAIKCRRLDESASPSGSGPSHRSPTVHLLPRPVLVQKTVEEIEQHTHKPAMSQSISLLWSLMTILCHKGHLLNL